MLRPAISAGALALAGCSFVFVPSVSQPPTNPDLAGCKESRAAPVGDLFFAGAETAIGVGAILTENPNDLVRVGPIIGPIAFGLAAVGVVSAIYGFVHSERCREAHTLTRPGAGVGQAGGPCIPNPDDPVSPRCDRGLACRDGRCY